MERDLAVLQSQRLANKLFIAGGGAGYKNIWIRDNVYVALAYAFIGQLDVAGEIYSGLLKIINRYNDRLDAKNYPEDDDLLLPRFTVDGDEVPGPWSNKQHDAIGALLYGVGQLHQLDSKYISKSQAKLVQKLVHYLETCRYWQDKDNGMWEEKPALHASSLAACIKGIQMVGGFCNYDAGGLKQAQANLEALLPKESKTHPVDMALLSLIWPYGYKRRDIVEAVEKTLLRKNGLIRYVGDVYESDGTGEPEWAMGIPWLGIAFYELGDKAKAAHYLHQTDTLYTGGGLPESYQASNRATAHTPLAWSHALALVLRAKLGGKK